MRKYIYLFFSLAFFNLIFCEKPLAQTTPGDSSSQQNALNNALTFFHSSLGEQSPLYNGPEYYYYDPNIKNNAYFMDVNGFTPGSVFYDGSSYYGAPMLYDLYSDQLVILLYNHYSKYSLIKEKVKSFDFLDHHFINISADTIKNNLAGIKSGYYDLIYSGKSQVLVKRTKSIQSSTGGTLGLENYFTPSIEYYIKKNNTYYSASSQGAVLDALKDKKKELEQYIKASQIKFRKTPEDALVKILSYYDHLNN